MAEKFVQIAERQPTLTWADFVPLANTIVRAHTALFNPYNLPIRLELDQPKRVLDAQQLQELKNAAELLLHEYTLADLAEQSGQPLDLLREQFERIKREYHLGKLDEIDLNIIACLCSPNQDRLLLARTIKEKYNYRIRPATLSTRRSKLTTHMNVELPGFRAATLFENAEMKALLIRLWSMPLSLEAIAEEINTYIIQHPELHIPYISQQNKRSLAGNIQKALKAGYITREEVPLRSRHKESLVPRERVRLKYLSQVSQIERVLGDQLSELVQQLKEHKRPKAWLYERIFDLLAAVEQDQHLNVRSFKEILRRNHIEPNTQRTLIETAAEREARLAPINELIKQHWQTMTDYELAALISEHLGISYSFHGVEKRRNSLGLHKGSKGKK